MNQLPDTPTWLVIESTGQTVTLWDGFTKDPDHPLEPAGLMTMAVGPHMFEVGDRVNIVLRKS